MQPSGADDQLEIVALLGTAFSTLEHQGTRWRFVLRSWASNPRVKRLVAVDYPKLTPRFAVSRDLAVARPSWLDGCELVEARVPVHRSTTLGSVVAWSRTGRAVRALLGPPHAARVAVAATPLSTPLLRHLGAAQVGFDAVDDWRALPGMRPVRAHVARGYRSAPSGATCTAVSEQLAGALRQDFGLSPTVIPNGVDLQAYQGPAPAPDGLPDQPFAVYVGVVQQRFDFQLLEALVAADVPVVVAGPASGEAADRLQRSGARWLGRIDVGLVPGLLQQARVGLVPHTVDSLTMSMDPMKVLEYLAAGLRVVTTPVSRAVSSDRVVEANAGEYVAAVQAALAAARPRGADPAIADRDWSVVASRLLEVHAREG